MSSMTDTWSDPEQLSNYTNAKKGEGVYVIGERIDWGLTVAGSGEYDPYLLNNWPENFQPRYIGISESKSGYGVRTRLSKHARKKGNKGIKKLLEQGKDLYYICIYGPGNELYESLFLCLQTDDQFNCNVRGENDRGAEREYKKMRSKMTPQERAHYDSLDIEESGM